MTRPRPAPPTERAITDPRMRRRRVGVRRQRRRRFVMAAAAVSSVALTGWIVGWSPLLRVTDVLVEGAERTPEAAVVNAADLGRHDHLFLLDADAVAGRVEELPWVRSADVDRILPGKVRISIKERRPAIVLLVGGDRWTLDATGRVLQAGDAVPGLPVLTGGVMARPVPGNIVDGASARHALRAWRTLPARVRTRVRGIVAPTLERITFVLDDGTQVRYGAAEHLRAKNAALLAVLARVEAEGRTPTYIDVRVPATPAVRFADAAVATSTAAPSTSPSPGASPTTSPSPTASSTP